MLVKEGPINPPNTAPIPSAKAKENAEKPFKKKYAVNAVMQINGSDNVVHATEFFSLLPKTIWLPVTIGPNPPPEIPLLNAEINPTKTIFLFEYLNWNLSKINNAINKTNIVIYQLNNCFEMLTATKVEKIVARIPNTVTAITVLVSSLISSFKNFRNLFLESKFIQGHKPLCCCRRHNC